MLKKTATLRLFGKDIDVHEVDDHDSSDQKSDDHDQRDAGMSFVDTPSSSGIVDDAVPISNSFNATIIYNPMPLRCVPPESVSWDGATSSSSVTREDRKAGKRKQQDVGGVRKKRRSGDGGQDAGEIPPGLLQSIETRNGTDLFFLYQKVLNNSDVEPGQNRLFVGGQHNFFDLLTPSEINAVFHCKSGLEVVAIDPQEYSLKIKIWPSLNIPILNVEWSKVIKAKKAGVGDRVRIWGYRVAGKLCLAVSFVENSNSGSSSNTAEEGTSNIDGGGAE